MALELAIYTAIATAAVILLLFPGRRKRLLNIVAAMAIALGAALAAGNWRPASVLPPSEGRPLQMRQQGGASERGFVSSNACRSCHPHQYATWYRSFHRTMTQVVTPQSVLGDFDDLQLWFDGRRYDLFRQGDGFWAELSDPDGVDRIIAVAQRGGIARAQEMARDLPRVRRRIVMSTGSHHYQLYWYPSGSGRELYMLPFVYLLKEKRWLPRVSVFLVPPNEHEPRKIWNRDCLPCHSTAGEPRYELMQASSPQWSDADSRFVETGVGCEACHGPGAEHVRVNQVPWRRYRFHLAGPADPTVFLPPEATARAAAQTCGQCHSLNTAYSEDDWLAEMDAGLRFQAGEDLSAIRYVVSPKTVGDSSLFERWLSDNPRILDNWFWPDGQIRVTGREYNGLLESPCYRGGKFSCLSCHSMHDSDPDDQLKAGMDGDEACLRCHEKFRARIAEHSRHKEASSGSRCYNCHLPHTTYGLLKASRSHTVENPSVSLELETGRPNGCNLCHLDQTLAWTARYLAEWYQMPSPPLNEEQRTFAAAPLQLLRGDAGVRAIVAWHMNWEPALEASGRHWPAVFLAQTLNDPYDAVRFISARSLKSLPGFSDFSYDFLDAPRERAFAPNRAAAVWRSRLRQGRSTAKNPQGFLADSGDIRWRVISKMLEQRDDRPIYLVE